jgi:NADH:ubiquinone oxidoreductase subunit
MSILSEIFSWWGGNTWGTRVTIWRQGRRVGEDDLGNTYYEQRKGVGPAGPLGRQRRWVVYKDLAEPSKVPPEWHAWLHYTVDSPPTAEAYRPKPWQRAHVPNMTGTREAYRPSGSILRSGERPKATGDYKPWQPQ